MSGLREALAAKRRRETTYPIAVADATDANERLRKARRQAVLANMEGEDSPDAVAAKAEVEAAETAVDECYFQLRLQALPRAEFEALVAAHPPGKDAGKDEVWDTETFRPALIAACAIDSDLTAQEWATELESWSIGDTGTLWRQVLQINQTTINEGVPKG